MGWTHEKTHEVNAHDAKANVTVAVLLQLFMEQQLKHWHKKLILKENRVNLTIRWTLERIPPSNLTCLHCHTKPHPECVSGSVGKNKMKEQESVGTSTHQGWKTTWNRWGSYWGVIEVQASVFHPNMEGNYCKRILKESSVITSLPMMQR